MHLVSNKMTQSLYHKIIKSQYVKQNEESRFSVPYWEKNKYIKDKPKGVWRMAKIDKRKITKVNKKYANKK